MIDLDQIISGVKQPSGRYSVETVKVDDDGHICDGLDTVYFDTMDDAQKSMELGLMQVKEGSYINGNGQNITTKTTKITGKGQIYFVNKFLGNED
jgi:hypothetical protein